MVNDPWKFHWNSWGLKTGLLAFLVSSRPEAEESPKTVQQEIPFTVTTSSHKSVIF